MTRKFLRRIMGVLLAGILFAEGGIGAAASENTTETVIVEETQTEQPVVISEEPVTPETLSDVGAGADVAVPTGLEVTNQTDTSVTLQWHTVEGCDGYKVYRKTTADTAYTLLTGATITTDSNTAAYTDTTCKVGQLYYYTVTAYKTVDGTEKESGFSDAVNNAAPLTAITFNKTALSLNKGGTETLTVSYNPSHTTDDRTVTWRSSNPAVATVAAAAEDPASAVVTAVGAGAAGRQGEAVITASVGDQTVECNVTVAVPLTSIALNKTEATLIKDAGDTLILTVTYLPSDTTDDKTVTWTSSNPAAATVAVTAEDPASAAVTAVGVGETVITASVGGKTAACKVIVRIPAKTITLSPTALELEKNDSAKVTITVTPEETTDKPFTCQAADDELVTCSIDGNQLTVTAKEDFGETEITVKAGDKKAVLQVRVTAEKEELPNPPPIPVNAVIIDKAALEDTDEDANVNGAINLQLGEEEDAPAQIKAEVSPVNATNKNLKWTSSNPSVAVVTGTGDAATVTAKGVGNAVITAEADNGVSDSVNVIVKPAACDIYITNEKNVILYCNTDKLAEDINKQSIKATHEIHMEDSSLTYEYYSSDINVATVDAQGKVTAKNPGKAVITVLHRASGSTAVAEVTVKRLVEKIYLPETKNKPIKVLKGTTTSIPFSLLPIDADKQCLKVEVQTSARTVVSAASDNTKKVIELTAIKAGIANITITAGDSYQKSSGATVNIDSARQVISVQVEDTLAQPASLKLTGTAKMQSDTTQTLMLSAMDADKDELNTANISIGYASSDEAIATVDEYGTVTAHKGGKVVITAYTLDGSNKKTTYTITVEQRPKEITFDREIYGVTQSSAGTASLTLKPIFDPTSTASTQKKVTWKIAEMISENGTKYTDREDSQIINNYFAVSASGVVSVKKAAKEGMKATILCTSAADASVTKEVVVQIQPKKVSKVKFNASTVNVVGLTEQELPFTPTWNGETSEIPYTAVTSNAEIATVKGPVTDGKVVLQAHKYGTVTVTLCADNAVTATCKVIIYPVAKGKIAAKEAGYLIQQTKYDANDRAVLQFTDAQKKIIDAALFTYKSTDSNIVYVDEKGIAYVNPTAKITPKNATVTITATLTDDPDKRTAKTKVTVCQTNQIERMDVVYYESVKSADYDKPNTAGKPLAAGTTMKWEGGQNGQDFVLRIAAYDAKGNRIVTPSINFTTSDTGLAYVRQAALKSYTGDNNKKYTWEIIVRVVKPGKFSVIGTAQDEKKVSRKLDFGVYDGKPILATKGLGTVHKNGILQEIGTGGNKGMGVAAQSDFILLGANGTQVQRGTIRVNKAEIQVQNPITKKAENKTLNGSYFVIKPNSEKADNYSLIMDAKQLSDALPGTYEIILYVTRTALPEESNSGIGGGTPITHELKTTFTISNTMPKFSDAKVTLNTFIRDDKVKIPLKTDLKIESVKPQSNSVLQQDVTIVNEGDDWYVQLKEEKFDAWNKTSTSGKIEVALDGYQDPVTMRLTVTTKSTKPTIKQQTVPSINLTHLTDGKATTSITLVDAKKNVYEDYTAELAQGTENNAVYTVEAANKAVKVTFKDAAMYMRSQGTTYKQKIRVKKNEWRDPIETTVSVKAYNGTSIPTITFAKSALNINRHAGVNETAAETVVNISHSNVPLKEGEWTIPATCTYKKDKITYLCADAFKAEYQKGILTISLRKDEDGNIIIPNGTYSFTMTNVWEQARDELLTKPLTTAKIKVVVKEKVPVVTVKMSGKLDLINRSASTLKGTVTVSDTNSTVHRIDLDDKLAEKYYCTQKDNVFTLYARNSAVLTTTKTTGTIRVTMTDGTTQNKAITFTPSQSTPKIGTPDPLTIYKSADSQTVDYYFNNDITKGVQVNKIETLTLPEGLKVQESGGHLFVTLKNKTLKAGTYQIKVNCYVKGAQAITNSPNGKAVQKTIKVIVTE